MQRFVTCPRANPGAALAGAWIVTAALVTAPPGAAAHVVDVQLTAGDADITLDLVRHGQSTDDLNGILGTLPPGAHLTALGEQQAAAVATSVQQEFPGGIAGIYASDLVRTQESAVPLAQALSMPVQVLAGLNEIPAGIFEGQPRDLFTEIGYFAPMAAWVLGGLLVPELGSINGVQFDEQVTGAVDTIYHNTIAGNGPLTDVAYSSGGPIAIWTLMNVKNPPFLLLLEQLLKTLGPPPNAGQAILEGNPTNGWTLVSWDGQAVSATPDLFTGLFVDFRDLITAPQIAAWNFWEALWSFNLGTIASASFTGLQQVFNAAIQFPFAVIDTILGALGVGAGAAGTAAGDAAGDVAANIAGSLAA